MQPGAEDPKTGIGRSVLDDAIAMEMEELFVGALTSGHEELGAVVREAERVCLDAVVVSDGPALREREGGSGRRGREGGEGGRRGREGGREVSSSDSGLAGCL